MFAMKKMLATMLSLTLTFGMAVMPVCDAVQSAKSGVISVKADEADEIDQEEFDDFYDDSDKTDDADDTDDEDDTDEPSDDTGDDDMDDTEVPSDEEEVNGDDSDADINIPADKEDNPVDSDSDEEENPSDGEENPDDGDYGEEGPTEDVDVGYDDTDIPSDNEQEDTLPDFEYETNNEKSGDITILAYYGTSTDVVIPEAIKGHKVTAIGENCFAYSEISSVIIPQTVIAIGENAFFGCAKLKSVTIPKTVKSIGDYAFGFCDMLPDENLSDDDFGDLTDEADDFDEDAEYAEEENEGPYRYADFKFYCYQKTAGETYAKKNVLCYTLVDSSKPVTVHSYTGTVTKKATCTTDGVKTYKCTCGEKSYTEKIKATGHKFGNWTTSQKATCTTEGKQIRKCSLCGNTETRTVKATGHKYTTKTVKPTCTAKGYTLHTCSVCKKSYKDNYKNALGHKYVKVKVVKPTLKSKGYTLYKCTRCGGTLKKSYVPALVSISKAKISGIKDTSCTGKQIRPGVKVTVGKTTLKNGSDYTVKYGTNKIGKATVTINGKGKYAGSVTKSFTITPRKTSVTVKSTSNGKISANISTRPEASKYEIQISLNKKFTGAKTYTVTSSKSTLAGVSNKINYVRVRTVYGKYTSSWSDAKQIKVK